MDGGGHCEERPAGRARLVGRRLLAFGLDWCAMALWGGAVFLAVMLATGGDPPAPSGPWSGQAIGFLAMTLPVLLYFALFERSRWRASPGKRLLGLKVGCESGERLPFARALLRNAIKLAPWELGHTAAHQSFFAREGSPALWIWLTAAGAMIGPLWWIAAIHASGRAPYDRLAGARVR